MNKPLVSVLMPAYNAEPYIAAALDSVFSQSYENIEIIVVNDGSTDNTGEILKGYEGRLRVINQENRGQCAACNAAFRASSGTFIKFFDADDLLSPDMISLQVEALQAAPDCIAYAEWGRFYNDDPTAVIHIRQNCWQDLSSLEWLVRSFDEGPNMMQCGIWLLPRAVVERAGLWDERLSLINDFDFMIRVILQSKEVKFVAGAQLLYRSGHAGSLSATQSHTAAKSALLSTRLGIETLLQHENSDRTRRIAANCFQLWAYRFYPQHPKIALDAEQRAKLYGGSDHLLPGGSVIQWISKCVGWRLAIRLRSLLYQTGWRQSLHQK